MDTKKLCLRKNELCAQSLVFLHSMVNINWGGSHIQSIRFLKIILLFNEEIVVSFAYYEEIVY